MESVKRYRENKSGLHIAEIEVTDRCNLSCFHCYAKGRKPGDIDYAIALNAINQLNEMGVNRLVFTGGEPLLYPHLFLLAKHAKDIGIPEIALLTNGMLATDKNIEDLKIFDRIQISIDFIDSTQGGPRPSTFSDICKQVSFLFAHDIKIHLFATIHKLNIGHVDDLIDAAEHLGVTVSFNTLIPMHPGQNHLRLSIEEHKSLLQSLHDKKLSGRSASCSDRFMFYFKDQAQQPKMPENKILGGCLAGIAAMYITKEGEIWPCPFVQMSCGSTEQLSDIWENGSLFTSLRDRRKYSGQCGSCEHTQSCGGCRAASLASTGSITSSDPNCIIKCNA
jgi:radical SAM protein with 4Fe4S-binding SPASM domain